MTSSLRLDDAVKRVLRAWSQERDPRLQRLVLRRAQLRLTADQRLQLIDRLAEISLGHLAALQDKASRYPAK